VQVATHARCLNLGLSIDRFVVRMRGPVDRGDRGQPMLLVLLGLDLDGLGGLLRAASLALGLGPVLVRVVTR